MEILFPPRLHHTPSYRHTHHPLTSYYDTQLWAVYYPCLTCACVCIIGFLFLSLPFHRLRLQGAKSQRRLTRRNSHILPRQNQEGGRHNNNAQDETNYLEGFGWIVFGTVPFLLPFLGSSFVCCCRPTARFVFSEERKEKKRKDTPQPPNDEE